jgi:hypothetical protein
MPAFWSQVDVSQSAASAAGSEPPITQPKKRPPALPVNPSRTSATSRAMTSVASAS